MSRVLAIRNRQRVRAVDIRLLRRIAAWAITEHFSAADYELGIHLVTAVEMAGVNEIYLGHRGSTDVITFDHTEAGEPVQPACRDDSLAPRRRSGERAGERGSHSNRRPSSPRPSPPSGGGEGGGPSHAEVVARNKRWELHGEIFISLEDAVAQAREFGATWQDELVRYLLHGLLHLQGLDDRTVADRRRMKREENRLLRLAAHRFPLRRLLRTIV